MAIDLTTPEIVYGNGNFKVDKNGELNASVGTIGASNSSKIHIGGTTSNSFLYSGNKTSLNANSQGFYLGTDGFSMGQGGSGNGFTVTPGGEVTASSIMVQTNSNSTGRIELLAGSNSSQINFYYGNSNRGYIRGSSSGIYISGNSYTTIAGSGMDITANSLDISSSSMRITSSILRLTPGTLIVNKGGGATGTAVSASYKLLEKTGCLVAGFGPVLIWYNTKRNLTFYNGILVEDRGTSSDGDHNTG